MPSQGESPIRDWEAFKKAVDRFCDQFPKPDESNNSEITREVKPLIHLESDTHNEDQDEQSFSFLQEEQVKNEQEEGEDDEDELDSISSSYSESSSEEYLEDDPAPSTLDGKVLEIALTELGQRTISMDYFSTKDTKDKETTLDLYLSFLEQDEQVELSTEQKCEELKKSTSKSDTPQLFLFVSNNLTKFQKKLSNERLGQKLLQVECLSMDQDLVMRFFSSLDLESQLLLKMLGKYIFDLVATMELDQTQLLKVCTFYANLLKESEDNIETLAQFLEIVAVHSCFPLSYFQQQRDEDSDASESESDQEE